MGVGIFNFISFNAEIFSILNSFKQGVPGSIPGWLTNIVIYTFKDTAIGVLKAVNNISHSEAAATAPL